MGNVKKSVKNNVRKYRVWKGLLQKDLAKSIGISVSQIRLIESNKATPRLQTRLKICSLFNVSYNQMWIGDKYDYPVSCNKIQIKNWTIVNNKVHGEVEGKAILTAELVGISRKDNYVMDKKGVKYLLS